MICINAPIIPYKSVGNIKLYSKISDVERIIKNRKIEKQELNKVWIRYKIDDSLYLFFDIANEKLFKITVLEGYKGKLFDKIFVGMNEDELLKADPTLVYDDFEEVFESKQGYFLETNPIQHTVQNISIFVREMDSEEFEKGIW